MANSNYPTALDTVTNLPDPGPSDTLNSGNPALVHHIQHATANDAILAIEKKVGIDTSSDTYSLDYQMRNGGSQRKTVSATTSSLANGISDSSQTLPVGLMVTVIKIVTSCASWVRVYSDSSSQSADAVRTQTTDPTSGTGLLLEVITTSGALTIVLSPPTDLFNSASGVTTVPITVTNLSTTQAVTVTVTVIPAEGAPGEL